VFDESLPGCPQPDEGVAPIVPGKGSPVARSAGGALNVPPPEPPAYPGEGPGYPYPPPGAGTEDGKASVVVPPWDPLLDPLFVPPPAPIVTDAANGPLTDTDAVLYVPAPPPPPPALLFAEPEPPDPPPPITTYSQVSLNDPGAVNVPEFRKVCIVLPP
jgi:hypothetical protein